MEKKDNIIELVDEKIDKTQEVDEEYDSKDTDVVVATKSVKEKKHTLASKKIENAKKISEEAKATIDKCMQDIAEDVEKLDEVKINFYEKSLNPSELLLEKQDFDDDMLVDLPDSIIELADSKNSDIEIKDISSGIFKAIFMALMTGVVMLLAWYYVVTSHLGMSLIPEKILDLERINKILEWTSTQLGQNSNANIGFIAIVLTLLIVMSLVYVVTMSIRASNNLKLADKTENDISLYCTEKEECKKKMQLIRKHIQDATEIIKGYGIVIDEQVAKINRALYFEDADSYNQLHRSTKEEFIKTKALNKQIKALLLTPVAESGILTQDSIKVLGDTKKYLDKYVDELYSEHKENSQLI